MKKIFLTMLMLATFILGGCGGGDGNNSAETKKLVIGVDDEYAPMGFRNDQNELVGFDVDLAKEAARRLEIEIEFKPIGWNKKESELLSGNIDIIWNGLDITPERKENFLYSKPYMDNRQILLVTKGNRFNIKTAHDLAGKIVGTQAGSNSETYVEQNENFMNSFAEFKTYDTYKSAFRDLENGAVDVLICDEIAARYEMIRNFDKFEPIELTIGPVTEIGIGFRKEDTALRDKVQKVFDEMIKDGTAREISEKWFQADLIKFRR